MTTSTPTSYDQNSFRKMVLKYDESLNTYTTDDNSININPANYHVFVHDRFQEIKRIKIPNENMVVIVVFGDDKEYKMVCREPDVFSLERACYLAIAKHEFGQFLTPSGIEAKATELSYEKEYEAIVKRGIAKYKRALKEEEEAKEYAKQQKENRIAENERKRKKAAKRRERRIEEMKEAYLRAWNQMAYVGVDFSNKDVKQENFGEIMCDDAK